MLKDVNPDDLQRTFTLSRDAQIWPGQNLTSDRINIIVQVRLVPPFLVE